MKKRFLFILSLFVVITLMSCTKKIHTVKFDLNGGIGNITEQKVKDKELAIKPEVDPTKEGFNFIEWQLDGEEFLFSRKILKDLTLVAFYKEDEDTDGGENGDNGEDKVKVERNLYTLDFGSSNISGYDPTSLSFKNGNDDKNYTLKKQRAQIYFGGVFETHVFVMGPIGGKNESFLELDLTKIEPSKIEFYFRAWSDRSFNNITKDKAGELKLQVKVDDVWTNIEDSNNNSNIISQINKDELTFVSFNVTKSAIYRIYYKLPSAGTGNTSFAIGFDDLSVYHLVESDGTMLNVSFDENYPGGEVSSIEVEPNGKLTELPVPTRALHTFEGWYLGDTKFDINTPITSDLIIVARWTKSQHIVEFDLNHFEIENVIIEISEDGKTITPIKDPIRDGYDFIGWYKTVINTDIFGKFDFDSKITEDIRLVAKWDKVKDDPVYERNDDSLDEYYKNVKGLEDEALVLGLRKLLTNTAKGVNYGDARYILDKSDKHPYLEGRALSMYDRSNVNASWLNQNNEWEREHVWANSKLGVDRAGNSTINQASDLHNLRVIIGTVNQRRSNFYFVNTTLDSPIGHIVVSGESYYPGDEEIGDVARILMYMATRYEVLTLTDDKSLLAKTFKEDQSGNGYIGLLSVLLDWHLKDPVDDFEINRNEVIFSYQKNRNPFIDHPELFEEVFNYYMSQESLRSPLVVEQVDINTYTIYIDYSLFNENRKSTFFN